MNGDFFAILGKTVRGLRGRLDRVLQSHGLRLGQYQVLRMLWENDGLTPRELAARLNVEMPTITRTVQRMVRDGFVQREAHRSDARSVLIRLTPLGIEKKAEVARFVSDEADAALARFSKSEREALFAFLERINVNIHT